MSSSAMAELLGKATAAKGERPSGLALAKCEGLPRAMLESVSWLDVCVPGGRARENWRCVGFARTQHRGAHHPHVLE